MEVADDSGLILLLADFLADIKVGLPVADQPIDQVDDSTGNGGDGDCGGAGGQRHIADHRAEVRNLLPYGIRYQGPAIVGVQGACNHGRGGGDRRGGIQRYVADDVAAARGLLPYGIRY